MELSADDIADSIWRYQAHSSRRVIEMVIDEEDRLAFIDAHRHPEVAHLTWRSIVDEPNTSFERSYVIARSNILMHVLLFPNVGKIRDHINHNGCDNRAEKHSKRRKRHVGVSIAPILRQVHASWSEANGHAKRKTFTWLEHESYEAAYNAAVECREENAQRVIAQIHRFIQIRLSRRAKHGWQKCVHDTPKNSLD